MTKNSRQPQPQFLRDFYKAYDADCDQGLNPHANDTLREKLKDSYQKFQPATNVMNAVNCSFKRAKTARQQRLKATSLCRIEISTKTDQALKEQTMSFKKAAEEIGCSTAMIYKIAERKGYWNKRGKLRENRKKLRDMFKTAALKRKVVGKRRLASKTRNLLH